jgi:AcrR family transcriptional regulator
LTNDAPRCRSRPDATTCAPRAASSSQIYRYFADKQALLLAVIDYQTEAVLDQQAPHLDRLDTITGPRAWRDMLVEYQKRMQCRGGCPIGTIGSQTAETNPEARLAVAAGYLRWENAIRAGLATMHNRGDLAGNPDDLALALLTALQGGLLMTAVTAAWSSRAIEIRTGESPRVRRTAPGRGR